MNRVEFFNGACPTCFQGGEYLNNGREHWGFCDTHKVRWRIGVNLYSSWQFEDLAEQFFEFERIAAYTVIQPVWELNA